MNEFSEYSKVSVHNHFGDANSERKIDELFNKEIKFNYLVAIESIESAAKNNYNLLAFTNANVILVPQYFALKRIAKVLNINVVPGVELNIIDSTSTKILHLVVIFDSKSNLYLISEKLNKIIYCNKKNYITIPQLVELIIEEKVILIPHGIKQSRSERSSADNPEQFKEIISMIDAIPIIIEDNKAYHKKTLKFKLEKELNEKENLWLDKLSNISCADRQNFDDVDDPTYIWGGNTFNDLYFSVLMQGSRIKRKNDIINKPNYISRIEIKEKNENAQITNSTINCSHGLNSIIGRSGSGKTLLLNAINKILTNNNLTTKTSGISEYNEIYKDVSILLYDINNQPITTNQNWKVFEGDNLYNKILQVYSSDKTKIISELNLKVDDELFKSIMENFSKNISNYIRCQLQLLEFNSNMKLLLSNLSSNIKFLEENNTLENTNINYFVDSKLENEIRNTLKKINVCENDLKEINSIISNLTNYSEKYKISNIEDNLSNIKKIFNDKIILYILKYNELYLKYKIKYEKQNYIYNIIKNYNSKLGKKIEEILIKKQENMDTIEKIKYLLINYYTVKSKCNLFPLEISKLKNSLKLEKNDLSKLITGNINLNISYDDLKSVFSNNIGSSNNKINQSKFKNIKSVDLTNYVSLLKFLQIFIEEKYEFPININLNYNNYIECKIELKNSFGKFENIETMSAGELSKTYISNMLEQQINNGGSNLIILFDQPDNSLEKKFILEELVSKIDKLRNKYQVFITTHEPLLVVNADSNNIIQAENDKIAVSSNNNICYKNLSFIEETESKEKMVNIIAALVDGSYDAVKERNKIYGGIINENNSN